MKKLNKSPLAILQGKPQEFIAGEDALHSGQGDAIDFFKDFETEQKEVFEWLRDEYRSHGVPMRVQRDVDAINGDTWYLNYQIKECEGNDKSSLCNGAHVKQSGKNGEKHAPEISDLFDDSDKGDKATWSGRARGDDGKLQEPVARREDDDDSARRINDKNMELAHLFPVGFHHELSRSNYSLSQLNVEARLSAKQFLAKQQNAIHEIEMKHQHLHDDEDTPSQKPAELNDNQLRPASSNSNFPLGLNVDTSSGKRKRSSGQPQHFDDQSSQKKNDLLNEVDEKLSKKEQQGLEMLHRVKRRRRRDVNMKEINRMMEKESAELKSFFKSQLNGTEMGEQQKVCLIFIAHSNSQTTMKF